MKQLVKIAFPLLLGVFFCVLAYNKLTDEQLQEIHQKISKVNASYLLISVFLGVLSHISRAIRWGYLLSPLGYRPKKMNMIMAVFVGYLLNLTIPRSGEVSRALVLTRYEDVPFDKSFGTIIIERIIDMLILFGLTAVVLCFQYDVLKSFLLQISPKLSLQILVFGIVICVLLGVLLYWIFHSSLTIAKKAVRFFMSVKQGIQSIFQMKQRWWFIAHTLFIWGMYIMMFYVAFFALDETLSISFKAIITAFVVGSFAITFTNGGLGAYPLFIAQVLCLFGVPYEVGTAFGWIMWLSQFLMMVAFGTLSFIGLPFFNEHFNRKPNS